MSNIIRKQSCFWSKNRILQAALILTVFAGFFLVIKFNNARANNLSCSSNNTLETLVKCITGNMPLRDSNGFVVPTFQEREDWRKTVRQMLDGSCDFPLPVSLNSNFAVRTFLDTSNYQNYCILMETADADNDGYVDRGWGTFVVYNKALRELSHQAPHPLADSTTEIQAVTLFKETFSRSYLLAGAHRDANLAASSCINRNRESDAAHNSATVFQAANEELAAFYLNRQWNAIQWHGMSADTCLDAEVYLSAGLNAVPPENSKIMQLSNALLSTHPSWKTAVSGNNSCPLNAATNVQARLLSGVDAGSVCSLETAGFKDVFIHIEQDPNFRSPADWSEAIKAVWSLPECAPQAPLGFNATAGDAKVSLSWLNVNGAAGYNLKRSSSSNGPFSVLSTISATEYTDFEVTNNSVYYYVISSFNSCGESVNSDKIQSEPRSIPPLSPLSLTATAISKSKISLKWEDISSNEDYFTIERSRDGISFSSIANTGSNTQSYLNNNLKFASTYYYRVKAVNKSGASPYSNISLATTFR